MPKSITDMTEAERVEVFGEEYVIKGGGSWDGQRIRTKETNLLELPVVDMASMTLRRGVFKKNPSEMIFEFVGLLPQQVM